MLDRHNRAVDASYVSFDSPLDTVRTLLTALDDFALAGNQYAASQHRFSAFAPQSLASRYAAANSITRRRFDAILGEAETTARTGVALIIARGARPDRSTIVAARFLGKSVAASLRKLDALLAPQTA